ncbi:WD repeat-containing protein 64-like isoform X1 [Oryzias latipes]
MLLYAADRIGYVFVFSMSKFDLDQNSPRAEMFWRAHASKITSLQIVDSDQVVLTSSTDHTVRLWSAYGECIGTFGQPEIWNIHVSSSWMHPTDPYEVLIDPLSMPNHGTLNGKPRQPKPITRDKTEPDRGELKKTKN